MQLPIGTLAQSNGLITPHRPMRLEAVAGKNPITHVGKHGSRPTALSQPVDAIVRQHLGGLAQLSERLVEGQVRLF